MNNTKKLITLMLAASMTGCAAIEEQMMSDIGNNLSVPYQSPQIVIDISSQSQPLNNSMPIESLKKAMVSWHAPSLIAAEIFVPEKTSQRTMKRLEKQLTRGPLSATYKVSIHTSSELSVTTHFAVANLAGCDQTSIKPELRDGKTGYSPALECSTLSNLVASVADPRDLLSGKALRQPNSINATSAIQNYYSGQVQTPSLQDVSVGGSQ